MKTELLSDSNNPVTVFWKNTQKNPHGTTF